MVAVGYWCGPLYQEPSNSQGHFPTDYSGLESEYAGWSTRFHHGHSTGKNSSMDEEKYLKHTISRNAWRELKKNKTKENAENAEELTYNAYNSVWQSHCGECSSVTVWPLGFSQAVRNLVKTLLHYERQSVCLLIKLETRDNRHWSRRSETFREPENSKCLSVHWNVTAQATNMCVCVWQVDQVSTALEVKWVHN